MSGEEVGDIFRDGKAYDVHVWSTPDDARQRRATSRSCSSTRRSRGPCRSSELASVKVVPTPNRIKHENARRLITVGANVDERDLGAAVARRRGRRRGRSSSRRATTPSCWASSRSASRPRTTCCSSRSRPRSACCSSCRRRSGAGAWRSCPSSPCRSALVGGVLAAYVGGGVLSLGSLVGFFTVLGHRGAQRDHDDQPLPAPRAGRGRALRPGARRARRARAAVADPDDGAGHRPGARPAGPRRRPARPRRSSTRWRS